MNSFSRCFAALELAPKFIDTAFADTKAYVLDLTLRVAQVMQKFLQHAVEYASQKFNFSLKKVTAFSADAIVNLAFDENYYREKIEQLRADLLHLSHSTALNETARVLSCHLVDYLQAYSVAAEKMDADLRPTWAAPLVDENSSFTLAGEVVSTQLSSHPKLIASLLEVNFLKMFHNLALHFDAIQTTNPHAGLDFLQDVCSKLTAHFDKYQLADSAAPTALARLSNAPVDTHTIAQDLLAILLPEGAKTLEIPGPGFIATPIQAKLYNILHEGMVPGLVQLVIPLIDDPLTRDNLLIQGFELLRGVINEDSLVAEHSAPQTPKTDVQETDVQIYSKQEALNSAVGALICNFLEYIDPLTKRRIVRHMSQEQLGTLCGSALATAVSQKPLIEHANALFSLLLPIVNCGGKWLEGERQAKEGKNTFLMAPSVFPKRREEFDLSQAQLEECKKSTHDKLSRLVEEIGAESKGVMRLASNQFLAESTEAAPQEGSPIWGAFEFVQNSFFFLQSHAKRGAVTFSVRHVCRKMRVLSKDIFIKMREPIHAQLLSSLTLDALQFLKRTSSQ